jgi:hypothetical protein
LRQNTASGSSIDFINVSACVNFVNFTEFSVKVNNWLGFIVESVDSGFDSFFTVIFAIRSFGKATFECDFIVNFKVENTLAFASHGLEVESLVQSSWETINQILLQLRKSLEIYKSVTQRWILFLNLRTFDGLEINALSNT